MEFSSLSKLNKSDLPMVLKFRKIIRFALISIALLFSLIARAQNNRTPEERVKKFKLLIHQFSLLDPDTCIQHTDSIAHYRILFKTQGKFVDASFSFKRYFSKDQILYDPRSFTVTGLAVREDYYIRAIIDSPFKPIHISINSQSWEKDLPDSVFFVESYSYYYTGNSTLSNWIFFEDMSLKDKQNTMEKEKSLVLFPANEHPRILSFVNGKFLVMDIIYGYNYIGGQTNRGICSTYYLQKFE